jgi:hypothetical protein
MPRFRRARKRGNPAPAWPGPRQGACESTGNSRQVSADRGIMMNEITTTAAPSRNRGHLPRRALRTVLGLGTAACALALTVCGASAAPAQVNPSAPEYVFSWGDCPVTLGSVAWTQRLGSRRRRRQLPQPPRLRQRDRLSLAVEQQLLLDPGGERLGSVQQRVRDFGLDDAATLRRREHLLGRDGHSSRR